MSTGPLDCTLIVLTLNEERHLPRLFASIEGVFKRVIVVDSFSTDRTPDICRSFGAEFYQRPFRNHADQFAWGMQRDIVTEWTMKLDADEVLEPGFVEEFHTRASPAAPQVTGIELWWKVIFWDKRIRHGGRSPAYLLRLWRTGAGTMEQRWMDEHIVLNRGHSIRFKHGFADWNLNNLAFFVRKHNGYATKEAIDFLLTDLGLQEVLDVRRLSRQTSAKRRLKKDFYYKMHPLFSPFAYFFYRYYIRFGFLDGFHGLVYHFFQGFWYRFLVGSKIVEFRRVIAGAEDSDEIVARLSAYTGMPIQLAKAPCAG